jgi:hypothetical protein
MIHKLTQRIKRFARRHSTATTLSLVAIGFTVVGLAISITALATASSNCVKAYHPGLSGSHIVATGSESCGGTDTLSVYINAYRSGVAPLVLARGATTGSSLSVRGDACYTKGLWNAYTLAARKAGTSIKTDNSTVFQYYCTSAHGRPLNVTKITK